MADDTKLILTRQQARAREAADYQRQGFVRWHDRNQAAAEMRHDIDNHYGVSSSAIILNSMSRLRVYVSLTDPFLGPFVEDAKSKARTAYLSGTRNWHHHYIIDVAAVDIKLTGRAVRIKITPADSFYFEFATSGNPVETRLEDGVPVYNACWVGAEVRLRDGVIGYTPTIRRGTRSRTWTSYSIIERPVQVQLINETVRYPNTTVKNGRVRATETVHQSFTEPHSHTGVAARTTNNLWATFSPSISCGPFSTWTTRDYTWDMPPAVNYTTQRIKSVTLEAEDWYRSAGTQTVKSEYGDRKFIISVDANNDFLIVPEAAPDYSVQKLPGLDQNVAEIYIRRVTPTLPAWVYKPAMRARDYVDADPDLAHWLVDQPTLKWEFNHLGTKVAAVVMEREKAENDLAFWAIDANPNQLWTQTKFDTLMQTAGCGASHPDGAGGLYGYNEDRYFTGCGIVEATVKIAVTGPLLDQFTVEVTVAEVRRPSTSQYWPMFVGYTWYDIPKSGLLGTTVLAGTLVALDLEVWYQPRGALGVNTARNVLMSVKTLDTTNGLAEVEVMALLGAKLLAVDLTTLSMVLRMEHVTQESRYCPTRAGGTGRQVQFTIRHFAAATYHSGKLSKVFFPEGTPDDARVALQQYAAINARSHFATIQADSLSNGPWTLMPVVTPYDHWGASEVSTFRNWWAYQPHYWYQDYFAYLDPDIWYYGTAYPSQGYVKYRVTTPLPSRPATADTVETTLRAWGGDFVNLMFCTAPRFGWNVYQEAMQLVMNVTPWATFYTHPNGSWCYFDDGWIYDKNGLPSDMTFGGSAGLETLSEESGTYEYNTLSTYDITKVKHVVLDCIHFEFRRDGKTFAQKTTSFMEMYNKAVAKTKLEDDANLKPVQLSDLAASFIFNAASGPDVSGTGTFLELQMKLGASNWWYRDKAYQGTFSGGTLFPAVAAEAGNFTALNVYAFWNVVPYPAAGTLPLVPGMPYLDNAGQWRVRFANPLILMRK